jgi:serine O-acetyltransferase
VTLQARLAGRLNGRAGGAAYAALKLLGVEIPRSVQIGPGLELPHGSVGLVVHERTVIGANVKLFGGVTLGRADTYNEAASEGHHDDSLVNIVIEQGVIVGAGAKVLFSASGAGSIRIGEGSVIAANAVVTCDVPPGEVWGGIPARRLRSTRSE